MADGGSWDPARPGAAAPGEGAYSRAAGAAICARVAAGEHVRAICAEPGQPHRTTLANWARAHPEFGEAMADAQRHARCAERMADRAAADDYRQNNEKQTRKQEIGAEIIARKITGH